MMRAPRNTNVPSAILVAGALACCGCQWMAPRSHGGSIDVDTVDERGLREEYLKLDAHAAELEGTIVSQQLELAKRQADNEAQVELNRMLRLELDAATADLDFLEAQFITVEHRLTRDETRASAVASLADAQLLYEKFKRSGDSTIDRDVLLDVERRIAEADNQMKRDNFTATVYYANRATRLLSQTERKRNALLATGTARIVSVSSANLREGPGPDFKVVGRLSYGTVLVEVEQKGDWFLVKSRDGARGWVHHTLLY